MSVVTIEGTVRDGQIRLEGDVRLPENAKVYVVIPEAGSPQMVRVVSPRLVHRDQINDFQNPFSRSFCHNKFLFK